MAWEDNDPASPNAFLILAGIGEIMFGLFFLLALYFPYMGLDWIIEDGISTQSAGLLILFVVIAAPCVAIGLFMMAHGFSRITGWDPTPRQSLPGNPRPKGRESVVFGGHRSVLGPVFVFTFLLPFLLISPLGAIYGFNLLFEGTGEGACFLIPICMVATAFVYYLAGSILAKRTLRVDHNNGILHYKTALFGLRVYEEARPISEALNIREWKTRSRNPESGTSSERVHHAIIGEGEGGPWKIDITKMTQTNFIDAREISETLGAPLKLGKPR
tara:strand:+ start:169 stop:987 length:819 start_codon:yes stop_codon:yes gene_type:complete